MKTFKLANLSEILNNNVSYIPILQYKSREELHLNIIGDLTTIKFLDDALNHPSHFRIKIVSTRYFDYQKILNEVQDYENEGKIFELVYISNKDIIKHGLDPETFELKDFYSLTSLGIGEVINVLD